MIVTFNLLVALTLTVAISFSRGAHGLSHIDLNIYSNKAITRREEASSILKEFDFSYADTEDRESTDILVSSSCTNATTVQNVTNIGKISESYSKSFQNYLFRVRGGSSSSKKRKILILMSDTGGGHRASAQAIDQALSELFPGRIDVDVVDIWTDFAVWPFNRFVPSYRFMAKHPLIWRLFYAYGRFPPTKLFTEITSTSACAAQFRRAIERSDPDMVVSVHPLCQHIPIPIIKKMNKLRKDKPIPFITVVTDLGGAHPTWFNKDCDLCFVPSEAVQQEALKNGIAKDKIILHGLPVRPAFWKAAINKNSIRDSLGLKRDMKTVLIMGGGDGVGGLSKIATEMGKKLGEFQQPSQMVVVCGHNSHLVAELKAFKWPSNVNAVIKGFLNNVDEFMGASDCLVTKAGPGTIAEAMIRGLPVVLSSFLPGQVDRFE